MLAFGNVILIQFKIDNIFEWANFALDSWDGFSTMGLACLISE